MFSILYIPSIQQYEMSLQLHSTKVVNLLSTSQMMQDLPAVILLVQLK